MRLTEKEYRLLDALLKHNGDVKMVAGEKVSRQSIYQALRRIRGKWRRAIDLNNQMLAFHRRGNTRYKMLTEPKESLVK
ncbi:helix-turn-helix domain-containing protein [Candidatus Bathyarchaeota archaeon]|nr:helix-turn-helix domain-containing protein [Candidatus Bathyarchaeota archaeon]